MLRKLSVFVTVLVLGAVFIYAQDKKSATITGFLVDNMCVKGNDKQDREHPTSCAKMPKCAASGYAIVSKDNVYKLDENGNKLAAEILRNTKQEKALGVKAFGTLVAGVLQVDTLEEVQPN